MYKFIMFIAILFISANTSFAEKGLNVSGISIGTDYASLVSSFPKAKDGKTLFNCMKSDTDSNKETCRISYCPSDNSKCKLWGVKSLAVLKVSSNLENKKVTRFQAQLDYDTFKAEEVKKILNALEKNLGTSTKCPIKNFLDDLEKKRSEFYCEWKSNGNEVVLELDDGHPAVTLRKIEE